VTTTYSVGTSGRTYSTIQAAWDALPSTLADDYRLECYNDSQFTAGLVAVGKTTSATFKVVVTAATGHSFMDHANVRSNALIYDSTKGVSFSANPFVTPVFDMINAYVEVERVQLKRSGNQSFWPTLRMDDSVAGQKIRNSIILKDQTGADAVAFLGNATAINCLFYNTSATVGAGVRSDGAAFLINCTVVSAVSGGTGINAASGTFTLNNTAVFGYTTLSSGTLAGDYNASYRPSMVGANSQSSLTFANQFESVTADFRVKAAANLIGGASTDATNAPNDITGLARGVGTAGDVGAWEWAVSTTNASGAGVTATASASNASAAGSGAATGAGVSDAVSASTGSAVGGAAAPGDGVTATASASTGSAHGGLANASGDGVTATASASTSTATGYAFVTFAAPLYTGPGSIFFESNFVGTPEAGDIARYSTANGMIVLPDGTIRINTNSGTYPYYYTPISTGIEVGPFAMVINSTAYAPGAGVTATASASTGSAVGAASATGAGVSGTATASTGSAIGGVMATGAGATATAGASTGSADGGGVAGQATGAGVTATAIAADAQGTAAGVAVGAGTTVSATASPSEARSTQVVVPPPPSQRFGLGRRGPAIRVRG
jgi:hypothetical protein